MKIFKPDDPEVLSGQYDEEGYTPKERRAQAKKRGCRTDPRMNGATCDKGTPNCIVHPTADATLPTAAEMLGILTLKERPMFAPDTPMTLTDVTFTTEELDEETHRVVLCTFALAPFTPDMAEALCVRELLFDAFRKPLDAIETVVLNITMPQQTLTFAMAPDQQVRRIAIRDVTIESKLRAKVKHDRDPIVVEAVLKVSFRYPTADELLYIANGVNDVHYCTFEDLQPELPLGSGDELRPGVHAEH